nr:unnamed protein product [Callosobruchus chinensis]
MGTWRTNIHLKTQDGLIQTEELRIRRGIFQGDTLSSLWFCLCLNPLSNTLNNTDHGFNIRHQKVNQHKINHLLYMDDIKLYAATEVQLRELLRITEVCTSDVRMEFGMSKCKALHINKGQWKNHPKQEIVAGQTLDNMDKNETYKYLGFNQSVKIDHTQAKGQLTQEFRDRLIRLLKTKLNSRDLTKAINTFAIPVLTYSFGIIKWSHTDIENIHILIRTELTKHHINGEQSYTWLQDGQLFPETEGFMLAIQDQVIATRIYKKFIAKDPSITDDSCRKCHQQKETIDHITGAYVELSLEPNVEIHTDKTVPANRPDIVFQSKADKVTYLIDIAIPNDKNILNTYAGKISKYTDLAIEIKRLWKQNKVIIVPFIMSVSGLTPNTFTPHLEQLGLDEKLHKIFQKSVILKTCSIVRSFLNSEL